MAQIAWTAPPLKFPVRHKVTKGHYEIHDIEVPAALVLAGVAALGIYGFLRMKGVTPFDWLWDELDKTRTGGAGMSDAERTARAAAITTGQAQTYVGTDGMEHTVVPAVKPGQSSGAGLTTDAKRYIAGIPTAFAAGGLQGDDLAAAQAACQIGTPPYGIGWYDKQPSGMTMLRYQVDTGDMATYNYFYDALYREYAAEKTYKAEGANYVAIFSESEIIWDKTI